MLHYRRLGLALVGILLLGSCQGTEWGSQVEQALRVPGAESLRTDPALEGFEEIEGSELELDSVQQDPEAEALDPDPILPDQAPNSETPLPTDPADPVSPLPPLAASRFEDLAELDPLAQAAIRDLEQLGVLDSIEGSRFEPERSIRRGEFAQWLLLANNAIHRGDPGRQIRLGRAQGRPIFLDVPEDHAQFRFIQALGAAGLIEGDDQQEFRPDSLLSRADLIRLKLAVVLPPGPMTGSRQDLEREWGFSDADRIPEGTVAAIVADRQAEHSTILHTFGVIRTLHPLDPVSRAEAALALSVMGDRSAAEALAEDPVVAPEPAAPDPLDVPLDTPPDTPDIEETPDPSLEDPTPSPELEQPDQPEPLDPSPSPEDLDPVPNPQEPLPAPPDDEEPESGQFITPPQSE